MRTALSMSRRGQFSLLCATAIAVAVGYVGVTRGRVPTDTGSRGEELAGAPILLSGSDGPRLLYVSTALDATNGRVASASLNGASTARSVAGLRCERIHVAAAAGICLAADRGVFTTYYAHILGSDLSIRHTIPLAGTPSRARVSPDGRRATATVFVSGDSYNAGNFSTRTVIVDVQTGAVVGDLETFTVWRDGARFQEADFNFWGVTFARDGNRFYATLASGGRIYLVEGDVDARRARVLATDIECPSLSPDNTRIVFKKRVSPVRWRLHVLDLVTLQQTPLTEARSVDDQAEWLDDQTVAYALPADTAAGAGTLDIWAVPVSAAGPPRLLVEHGASPTAVH